MSQSKKNQHQYIYYGTKTNTEEVSQFIMHVIKTNAEGIHAGKKKKAICIWGKHGIGKTELVESIARENGYKFTYIAPAQFEEMGDLLGMPKVTDDKTQFVPPAWVPTEDVPGILLIDDVNRADDRILRGIMQLLQNYELTSWKLPPQWHIILTANPDGGDYSVTPMDDAMITRMLHITLQFDIKAWARWAEKNNVDPRGINFALTYPEIIGEERTTPRTLVQFFDSIQSIKDLKQEITMVQLLADSCLDAVTSTTFIAFVQNNLSRLITPQEILNTKNFEKEVKDYLHDLMKGNTRLDILATLTTRLINYLASNDTKPTTQQLDNVKSFLKLELLPNDIRLSAAQDMMKIPQLKTIMADPYLGKLLLQKM